VLSPNDGGSKKEEKSGVKEREPIRVSKASDGIQKRSTDERGALKPF